MIINIEQYMLLNKYNSNIPVNADASELQLFYIHQYKLWF